MRKSIISLSVFTDIFFSKNGQRILIGICGIPASGKSSLAHAVVARVNEIHESPIAIVCGLDGWHLPRSILAEMPDPDHAFARRGAHWTFDGEGYVDFVRKLGNVHIDPTSGAHNISLKGPTFSHATKDPAADDLVIEPYHQIVVLEGLYAFLSIQPWLTAAELLDERWFIDVDVAEARKRIVARHVRTGVTSSEEKALERAEMNDFPSKFTMSTSQSYQRLTSHIKQMENLSFKTCSSLLVE